MSKLRYWVFLMITASSLWSCSAENMNTETRRVQSPDGKLDAVVFLRDGGATANFSTQVSLLPTGERLPNEVGNVFVSDDDHGKVKLLEDGTMPMKVVWESATQLQVQFDQKARVFKSVEIFSGTTIVYKPVESVDAE